MHPSPVLNRIQQQGFSMVELMVAMTLSLILMAGVLSLVYSSKVAYLENERVARNQEGGRAALDLIIRDLRGAGFAGCSQPVKEIFTPNNVLTNNTSLLWQLEVPMQGYEGSSGTWSPVLDPIISAVNPSTNNDILAIRTVRAGLPQFNTGTTTLTNSGDDVVVNKSASQKVLGKTFVINDCQAETFFVASQVIDNGTTATLKRTTDGTTPTNTSTDLGTQFHGNAVVAPVDTLVYYVGPSTAGTSLWRLISSDIDDAGNPKPEELVPGVERMEIQYGLDTDNDYIVNQYVDADTVQGTTNGWTSVISVRIALLVRSPQPNSPDEDDKTYQLLGNLIPKPKDHYERSVYTTTVALRNRTF